MNWCSILYKCVVLCYKTCVFIVVCCYVLGLRIMFRFAIVYTCMLYYNGMLHITVVVTCYITLCLYVSMYGRTVGVVMRCFRLCNCSLCDDMLCHVVLCRNVWCVGPHRYMLVYGTS